MIVTFAETSIDVPVARAGVIAVDVANSRTTVDTDHNGAVTRA